MTGPLRPVRRHVVALDLTQRFRGDKNCARKEPDGVGALGREAE